MLLLADSRLPAGGHVHSGGVEALVDRDLLRDVDDLACFLRARVRTAGLVTAALTAAAFLVSGQMRRSAPGHSRVWSGWTAAVDARTPSAALREVSRAQGAAMLRTVDQAWPGHPGLAGLAAESARRPHHPLVLGAAADAARVGPADGARGGAVDAAASGAVEAAGLAVHHMVGGAATAAVRLLGLDPLRVAGVQAALAPLMDEVAARAAEAAVAAVSAGDPDRLPADATPLPEILAELHQHTEVTLFAS